MAKKMWIDKNGNTCVGIKPDEENQKNEEKKEEVKSDDTAKNVKSNRRKRSGGEL